MARTVPSAGRRKTVGGAHEHVLQNVCPHPAAESGRIPGEKESGQARRHAKVTTGALGCPTGNTRMRSAQEIDTPSRLGTYCGDTSHERTICPYEAFDRLRPAYQRLEALCRLAYACLRDGGQLTDHPEYQRYAR